MKTELSESEIRDIQDAAEVLALAGQLANAAIALADMLTGDLTARVAALRAATSAYDRAILEMSASSSPGIQEIAKRLADEVANS